eukprot:3181190-Pyramimonas_sp.AAC.1
MLEQEVFPSADDLRRLEEMREKEAGSTRSGRDQRRKTSYKSKGVGTIVGRGKAASRDSASRTRNRTRKQKVSASAAQRSRLTDHSHADEVAAMEAMFALQSIHKEEESR